MEEVNEKLKELFDEFEQRHGMPMDKPFLDSLNWLHSTQPDVETGYPATTKNLHRIDAWHPEHGPVGSIDWDDDDHTVDMIYVDPKHRHKGVASELWNRAKRIEPDLKHSEDQTGDGAAWNESLPKSAQVQRHCVICKNIFSESEGGEATGFCSDCREKEGLVTHHSWSEDAQEGHYGAKYYHAAPTKYREAIESEGLHPRSRSLEYGPGQSGVFLYPDVDQAQRWAEARGGRDVYEVDVDHELDPDMELYDSGARVSQKPIPPERIRRLGSKSEKRAIMSIGIPGSGKSTLMKPYAEALGAAYVSSDETRGEVTGDPGDVSQDAIVWPKVYEKLHKALDENDTVVFDSTAANYEKRRDIIRHLRQKAGTVEGIHFDIPVDEALRRNETRDRFVPPTVIEAMHKQLQDNPPGDEFDSIQTVMSPPSKSGESPANLESSARLEAKTAFMRSPEASYEECRLCLGTGTNGGRRCGRCAATGSEGTVPCDSCGDSLRAFETFQRKTAEKIVPICSRCAQLQTDVLERLTEEARPKEMGGQEGFSRSIRNTKPSDGYMVSDAGSERRHDFDVEQPHLAVPHLEGFIRQNSGLLTPKDKYFGGWLDSENKLCLDVSENYRCAHGHDDRLCDDRKRAYIAGISNHQEMIFHVNAPEDDKYLDPRKNGLEDFPELEEFVSNYDRQRKSSVEDEVEKPDKHFIRIEKDNGDLDVDAMVKSMMDHLFPDKPKS